MAASSLLQHWWWALLTGFIAELQGLHQENGSILKETAKKEDKRLGKLYRAETGPTRLVAVKSQYRKAKQQDRLSEAVPRMKPPPDLRRGFSRERRNR